MSDNVPTETELTILDNTKLNSPDSRTILRKIDFTLDRRLKAGLLAGVGFGVIGLITGLLTDNERSVYQALLVNTLFFAGLTHGSILFSAIFTITKARWGEPIKQLAESTVLFIPAGWFLFILLFLGMNEIYDWTDPRQAIESKTWWLNSTFFIIRNSLCIFITGLIALGYVAAEHLESSDTPANPFSLRLKKHRILLAVLYLIAYPVFACLIAFDWIMSIDQTWVSSIFGFQYLVGNMFAAGAFLVIISAVLRRILNLQTLITLDGHNDLSRLVFALSLLWTYLVFSQILVIWYANLPAETSFLILRMRTQPWSALFYFLTVALFLIPYFGLLTRSACRSPWMSSLVAIVILVGLWVEKYYLIAPSMALNLIRHNLPATGGAALWSVLITSGTAALFLLLLLLYLENKGKQ